MKLIDLQMMFWWVCGLTVWYRNAASKNDYVIILCKVPRDSCLKYLVQTADVLLNKTINYFENFTTEDLVLHSEAIVHLEFA